MPSVDLDIFFKPILRFTLQLKLLRRSLFHQVFNKNRRFNLKNTHLIKAIFVEKHIRFMNKYLFFIVIK